MTVIAGIATEAGVWIGADSAGVDDLLITHRKDAKLFRVGQFLVGFAGSFRFGQLIRFGAGGQSLQSLELPPGQDPFEIMVSLVVPRLQAITELGGIEADKAQDHLHQLLVGFRGRLFFIDDDFAVGENADGLDACGVGGPLALAAMRSLMPHRRSEHNLLADAMGIAVDLSPHCRLPITIEKL